MQVVYDTSRSTKPSELVKLLSSLVQVETSQLRVAKHKIETFEWIRLQDSYTVCPDKSVLLKSVLLVCFLW